MYYVYVLKCNDGSFYTGYTNNVEKRVKRHNSGFGSRYTRSRLPAELMASFSFKTRIGAMRHEIYFKKLQRKEKMKLIEKCNCS